MRTSAPGRSEPSVRRDRCRGFTLIEMLITLVVIGIAMVTVAVNLWPADRQGLRAEAQRLSLLLAMAREEAQVRGAPVRLVADQQGYRFLAFSNRQWRLLQGDADLRQRTWQQATSVSVTRADGRGVVEFGRDAIDSPFVITLTRDGSAVRVVADGLGRFEVAR